MSEQEPPLCKKLREDRTYYVYRYNKKQHRYEKVPEEEKEYFRDLIKEVDKKLKEINCELKFPQEYYIRCNWEVKMPRGLLVKVSAYDEENAQTLASDIWVDYALDPAEIWGGCVVETPKQYRERQEQIKKTRQKREKVK